MDLASLITTPCFMIFSLYAQPGNSTTLREEASTGSGWLAFAMCFQSTVLLFGLFVTPSATTRPTWYNAVMPEAKLYSTKGACLILPWVIIGFAAFEQYNRVSAQDSYAGLASYVWYVIFTQLATFVWYLYKFRALFEDVYTQHCADRVGVLVLQRRGVAVGIYL